MPRAKDSKQLSLERRRFLQQGALAGAAALVGARSRRSAGRGTARRPPLRPASPDARHDAAAEATPPADVQVLGDDERCGSDYMVDVFKSLGFDYVCANPGSSFRGLHESFINYGGNTSPSSSPACTKSRPWRWRTATSRPRASRSP